MQSKLEKVKLFALVFFSGFVVMEMEILSTRILSPVFGGTIYVWSSLIGATLTFLAIGYWFSGKMADKGRLSLDRLGLTFLISGTYISLLPRISGFVLFKTFDFGVLQGPLVSSFLILALPTFLLGFIIPSSIKLATKSIDKIGTKAGELYSLSTIGSIAGTLVTGFYFVQYIGVAKTCLVTGLIMILLSLFLIKSKFRFLSLILFFLVLIPLEKPVEIVESFDSYYGKISVVESVPYRKLFMDSIPQTAINFVTMENAMGYILYFELPLIYNPEYKKSLMIGLGGGYTAKELVNKYGLEMDVVEIEPRMLDLAEKYFYWDGEANVYFDDGRHFLRTAGRYDLIFIDIGYVFPAWNLYTLEAFEEYSNHLSEDGILVINIFTAKEGKYSKLTQTLVKTLKEVFDEVLLIRNPSTDPETTQSMGIIASKRIDKNRLILSAKSSNYPEPIEEIIKDNLEFEINPKIDFTTDDLPLAEFYDYTNWKDWGLVAKGILNYFLPF